MRDCSVSVVASTPTISPRELTPRETLGSSSRNPRTYANAVRDRPRDQREQPREQRDATMEERQEAVARRMTEIEGRQREQQELASKAAGPRIVHVREQHRAKTPGPVGGERGRGEGEFR